MRFRLRAPPLTDRPRFREKDSVSMKKTNRIIEWITTFGLASGRSRNPLFTEFARSIQWQHIPGSFPQSSAKSLGVQRGHVPGEPGSGSDLYRDIIEGCKHRPHVLI